MSDETEKNRNYLTTTYLALLLSWFGLYMFCEHITVLENHVEIFRATMNITMAFTVVTVTFYERYKTFFKSQDYTAAINSNKLFLSFGLALVPFTSAMADLERIDRTSNVYSCVLIFLIFISISELIVALKLSNDDKVLRYTIRHILVILFFLICAVATSSNVGPLILELFNQFT
ncbi:TPA: hypothetical protein LVM22_001161 [Klebsiella oxytoca]|nr:hypothetical protein [Klebsiella oxytoca]